ncbi:hypothetical protein K461DRAFT_245802, partial [Myriangium duriaei CBS 260.36]
MAATPVVLILGAGPRIGTSVAEKFLSKGYKVAVASRKGQAVAQNTLALKADFSKPDSIPNLFHTVKSELGASPSVIIYNAGSFTFPPDADNLFSIPAEAVTTDLNVNTISAYVAAQQAVVGWDSLPKDTKKSFIYTGNIQNVQVLPVPMLFNPGMGKSATAYWIGAADMLYQPKGYRFFYADERYAGGKLKGGAVDGPAHGEFYAQLADHAVVPWHATFVKDQGYAKF